MARPLATVPGDRSQFLGAGGICASAADPVRWTHALHAGRVLARASYQAVITPRGTAVASHYGFGFSVEGRSGHHERRVIADRRVAELNWYPQRSLAVALLSNAYPRVRGVADVVARIVLGVPLPEAASRSRPRTARCL